MYTIIISIIETKSNLWYRACKISYCSLSTTIQINRHCASTNSLSIKEYKITSLRLADLEKELNYLKTTREREVAAMIAEARSYGDLSENSEYDAAKNEQGKLYGRIAEIEDILSHAVIIEDENEATGRVGLGCTVVVENEQGQRIEYRITGSQEANPMENKLSDDSPFGRGIVGKAAGETFTVNAPAGSYTMKVISVSREG